MTHRNEPIGDGLDCAGNVFIKSRVTRLEHRDIIFLSPYEQIGGVYLADVKDCVDGDLDWEWIRDQHEDKVFVRLLNSATPLTASGFSVQ